MFVSAVFLDPAGLCLSRREESRRRKKEKAFTKGCLSKELLYTCIRNQENSQVIPQTALSLRFEHQKNAQTIKNDIAGVQTKSRSQKNICGANAKCRCERDRRERRHRSK